MFQNEHNLRGLTLTTLQQRTNKEDVFKRMGQPQLEEELPRFI